MMTNLSTKDKFFLLTTGLSAEMFRFQKMHSERKIFYLMVGKICLKKWKLRLKLPRQLS